MLAGVRRELLERTRERIDLVVVTPERERAELIEECPVPRGADEPQLAGPRREPRGPSTICLRAPRADSPEVEPREHPAPELPDQVRSCGSGLLLRMPLESVERIAQRAGMTEAVTDLHPAAFVSRFGTLYLPYAEKLARAFAAAEPETVLLYIQDQEAEYKARGYEPGERFWHDYLRETAASYALARQWAGHEQEIEQLHKELDPPSPVAGFDGRLRPRAGRRRS